MNNVTVLNDRDMNFGKGTKKKPEWISEMGNFNSLPKPIKKSSYREFVDTLRHQTPSAIESRQIMDDDRKLIDGEDNFVHIVIYWFDTKALAMVYPSSRWSIEAGTDRIKYHKAVRYFRIGCQHETYELSQEECRVQGIYHAGRCWHVMKCKHCGMITSYDSSD